MLFHNFPFYFPVSMSPRSCIQSLKRPVWGAVHTNATLSLWIINYFKWLFYAPKHSPNTLNFLIILINEPVAVLFIVLKLQTSSSLWNLILQLQRTVRMKSLALPWKHFQLILLESFSKRNSLPSDQMIKPHTENNFPFFSRPKINNLRPCPSQSSSYWWKYGRTLSYWSRN